jgi:uncharacterized membrane protein required for colicin V production
MAFIDIIFIVIIAAFVFFGLFFGFVHTLGSLVGVVVAIIFSSRLVEPAMDTFGFLFGGGDAAKIILFIIIFFVISRLVGIIFWVIGKVWDIMSFIPFAKSIDRLLGGLLGFVEGIIVVGVILFYATQVLPENTLTTVLETSFMAKYLIGATGMLQSFFPVAATQAIEQAADSVAEIIPEPKN